MGSREYLRWLINFKIPEKSGFHRRYNGYFPAPALPIGNRSVFKGKEGIVAPAANVGSRMNASSTLAHQDSTGLYHASAKNLYTQILGI
jgi:hypothetical protein